MRRPFNKRGGAVAAIASAALAVALVAGSGCGGMGEATPPIVPSDGPNIVVITSDDQSLNSFSREVMPNTFRLLVDRGTRFRQGIAAPPLCCPSRAGFLTGQYPHNHGVFNNTPGLSELRDPEQTLPAWLGAHGYRTGFVGKYLNGTKPALGASPAPGWDRWVALYGSHQYFDAPLTVDGEVVETKGYIPATFTREAGEFVRSSAGDRPFFLWLGQEPPHFRQGRTEICPGYAPKALARDYRRFQDAPLPRPPSFNERDMSDKPQKLVAKQPPLDRRAVRRLERNYRCTLASMQEVDRSVAEVWRALKQTGEAEDTVVVFTSDNGLLFGEHRIDARKGRVYDEASRVPLVARVPPGTLGERPVPAVSEMVTNLDLTATLLDLANVQPCTASDCRAVDGRSAVGLLRGESEAWPDDRGVLLEQGKGGCKFAAIRTPRYLFAASLKNKDGDCVERDRELYDLQADPFQLSNLAEGSDVDEQLNERLSALRKCSGTTGSDACE
jgi:N-acetylglucosamine-6-sulfatase